MKSTNNSDNKLTISAVHHERNAIKQVKFDNGRTVSIQEAIRLAKNDKINDVSVGKARDGRDTLRSNPSCGRENFLSNKPEF